MRIVHESAYQPVEGEHHVVLVVHRDATLPHMEKAYFYDSASGDYGGMGPFDFLFEEARQRAERYAYDHGIELILIKADRS